MMRHLVKISLLVFFSTLLIGAGYAEAETLEGNDRTETLNEAIQEVLQTNPEVLAAAYNRLARDWEVIQARASFFPTIDGEATWGYNEQRYPSVSDKITRPRRYTVGIRQNVFRGGADLAELNRQKSRVDSQAYFLQSLSDNMALMTARVYMNVLQNEKLYELAIENLVNHERIADQVRLRMESGVDARAEMDQVTGRMALAKSNVVATEANLQDSITDFNALLGRYPGDLTEVEQLIDVLYFPGSLALAEEMALDNHPVIKSAKADLKARENQHKVSQRLLSPKVDLSGDYNWDRNVAPFDGRREHYALAATVSMNFFSGGRDYGRIQETSTLVREAQEILHNAQRQTTQSIHLSWEANRAARERVQHLQQYARSAQDTAETFAVQWNIGRRTMFDLLDTQAEAINARSDLVAAQYDLIYSEYRILNSLGRLVSSLELTLPQESRIAEGR